MLKQTSGCSVWSIVLFRVQIKFNLMAKLDRLSAVNTYRFAFGSPTCRGEEEQQLGYAQMVLKTLIMQNYDNPTLWPS